MTGDAISLGQCQRSNLFIVNLADQMRRVLLEHVGGFALACYSVGADVTQAVDWATQDPPLGDAYGEHRYLRCWASRSSAQPTALFSIILRCGGNLRV
jgi:hypothetical protein